MNKLILLLLIILIIPFMFSYTQENIPKQFAEDLKKDPSLVEGFSDDDLIKTLDYSSNLLDNKVIFEELNKRLIDNPNILNDYSSAKAAWFKKFGISDLGAKIASFDGELLKTDGTEACTFKIKDFSGFSVTKEGALLIAKDTGLTGEVDKSDGKLMVDGALIKNNWAFYSDNPTEIILDGDKTTLKGDSIDVFIFSEKNEVLLYRISGSLYLGEGNFIIGANGVKTTLEVFYQEIPSVIFEVENPTEYFFQDNIGIRMESLEPKISIPGEETYSRIFQDNHGNLLVSPINNEKINVKIPFNERITQQGDLQFVESIPGVIRNLKIDWIDDESSVSIQYHDNVDIKFSKEPFAVRGDISNLEDIYIFQESSSLDRIIRQEIGTRVDSIGTALEIDYANPYNEAILARKFVTDIKNKDGFIPVLVGVGEYEHSNLNLDSVPNDLNLMEDFLKRNNFDHEAVRIQSPTKEVLLTQLVELKKRYPDKNFLFYYSGHGYREGSDGDYVYYLLLSDVDPKNIGARGVSADELYDILPENSVSIFDCCHAGGFLREGKRVITSSSSEELSIQYMGTPVIGLFTRIFANPISEEALPFIDRKINELGTLKGNLEDDNWRTLSQALNHRRKEQTPQFTGFVVLEDDSLIFIMNKKHFGSKVKIPVHMNQVIRKV